MVKHITFLNYYNDEYTYSLFCKCEEIIDGINRRQAVSIYQDKCNNIDDNYSDIFNSNIKEICCQSLEYLNKVYNGIHYDLLYKTGFKYLYYWLYKHKFKSNKESSNFKVIYKEIIKIFNDEISSVTYDKDYQSVT
ncbi:variable surface protein, partial [Plasmodium gonderi]